MAPAAAGPDVLGLTAAVLGRIRRQKTAAKLSMRARVARCTVSGSPDEVNALDRARGDLRDAGGIDELVLVVGTADDAVAVDVVLAEPSD